MSKYTCTCGKQYVRQDAFKRHTTICQLVYNCNIDNVSNLYQPTNHELYIMIINLMDKYNNLEKQYDKLKYLYNKSKRNIDPIEYLSNNYNCSLDIIDFINSKHLDIDIHKLDYICDKGYYKGVLSILINYINCNNCNNCNNNCNPIVAINIKPNCIYVFYNKIWRVVDTKIQNKIFNIIDNKILATFHIWKLENQERLSSDTFSELYIKNMKKLMVDISVKNKIIASLYKSIVVNI